MGKLRLGIVGCGAIFKNAHLPAWLAIKDEVEIVAACDIIAERTNIDELDGVSKDIKKYTDYRDLLADKDVDMVDICTPNYLHTIVAASALNAGKHVITEKPDAVSIAEMEKVIEAEKKSGKVYMSVRNNRHFEVTKYFKKYIDEGNCGEFYCGRCGWIRRRGIPGKGGWFTTKSQSGGGPLIDLGAHMIDLALYFMGNPKVVSVSGCTYTKFADSNLSDSEHSMFGDKITDGVFDVEDLAMGFIKFENGACLQVECSWASNIYKEKNFVELRGTKGGLRFSASDTEDNIIVSEQNGTLIDIKPKVSFKSGHNGAIKHFVDVVNGKAKPDYTSDQGLNLTKIFDALYESAKTGKEVLFK